MTLCGMTGYFGTLYYVRRTEFTNSNTLAFRPPHVDAGSGRVDVGSWDNVAAGGRVIVAYHKRGFVTGLTLVVV